MAHTQAGLKVQEYGCECDTILIWLQFNLWPHEIDFPLLECVRYARQCSTVSKAYKSENFQIGRHTTWVKDIREASLLMAFSETA